MLNIFFNVCSHGNLFLNVFLKIQLSRKLYIIYILSNWIVFRRLLSVIGKCHVFREQLLSSVNNYHVSSVINKAGLVKYYHSANNYRVSSLEILCQFCSIFCPPEGFVYSTAYVY